jgi:phosphoribosylamine--glycine ligase
MTDKHTALVLGSGGREHALAMALARAPSVQRVLVAPGNPGCSRAAAAGHAAIEPAAISALEPGPVVDLARTSGASLVVVGPEAPLVGGVVDALSAAGVTAFGPTAAAAQLEGSKAFMKRFAARHDIPTAAFLVTDDIGEAERWIDQHPRARVVKADGLAAGKGAIVTTSADEAKAAARSMLVEGRFGDAGRTIIVEDLLDGVEMSVHAISDGERYWVLPVSRDHKRIGDGDRGPNTGGMGAFAPVHADPQLMERIERQVLRPTIDGMRADGCEYRGVLYAGVMVAPDGTPYLLEHNVRFGDPETQVLMALLDGDVAELLASAANGELIADAASVAPNRHAVVVVMAADGYPGTPRKGDAIDGIEAAEALAGVRVHQAGTARRDEQLVTAGGRVLGVEATGTSAKLARERAYEAIDHIQFAGSQVRRDIAASATAAAQAGAGP